MLVDRKQTIISESVSIEDKVEALESENENLSTKLVSVKEKLVTLDSRLTRLVCLLESQSEVLSQAEECMGYEIEGLTSHMQVMHRKLAEVSWCCGQGGAMYYVLKSWITVFCKYFIIK